MASSASQADAGPATRVALVGLGQIGSALAELAWSRGLSLALWTRRREAAQAFRADAARRLERQVRRGRVSEAQAGTRLRALRIADAIDDLGDVDLAIEAVAEDPDAKRDVLARLDSACGPGAVLASTTSEIPVATLVPDAEAAARAVGLHFLAPVRLTTAVELIPGPRTSSATLERAGAFCRALEREPFVFRRSVVNPLLVAYVAEGLSACLAGAAPLEVDEVATAAGFGLGPLASLDLIGLDVAQAVLERRDALSPTVEPEAAGILRTLLGAGHLGRKTGRGLFLYDDGEGLNPRFAALLARVADAPRGTDAVPGRLWLRLINELLLCLSAQIGSPRDLDRVVGEVLGLERGLRERLAASDHAALLPEIVRLERRLGSRYVPTRDALRAAS